MKEGLRGSKVLGNHFQNFSHVSVSSVRPSGGGGGRGRMVTRVLEDKSELWALQEELLKEIEIRRQLQSKLRSKLYQNGDAVTLVEEPFQLQPDNPGCPIPSEDVVEADNAPKVNDTFKVDAPPKVNDPFKVDAPPKVNDPFKVDAPPKVNDPFKIDPSPKVNDPFKVNAAAKVNDAPKIDHTLRVNEPPKANDRFKIDDAFKIDDVFKIDDAFKANEPPEVDKPPKVDEPPNINDPFKVNDVFKVDAAPKVGQPPKFGGPPKVDERPKIRDVFKIDAAPKVDDPFKVDPFKADPSKADPFKAHPLKVNNPIKIDAAPRVDAALIADDVLEVDDTVDSGAGGPPLAGENVMNVVLVGSECAPYSKTGGLADVMGALPKALAARGHRVMVVSPRYANYEKALDTSVRMTYNVFGSNHEVGYYLETCDGVDFVFIDHPCYHNRGNELYSGSRLDVAFRCALLCKAALEAPWHVPCKGSVYGDGNLVFVANDWHAALVPVYLQAHYRDHGKMEYTRSTLVLHNIAYQGRGPFAELDHFEIPEEYKDTFFLDDPVGGEHMNILKAAIIHCHRIVAVSHGYAWECQTQEGGWGLDGSLREFSWKLQGIVNGIDESVWNPQLDTYLSDDPAYVNYTIDSVMKGKAKCKAALQSEMGLPVDPKKPLFGFIGRLDYQKGVDLIKENYDWLMGQNAQLVMLGSGRDDLEADMREMEARNDDKCKCWVGFSVEMAHKITAGCDMLLMPSRFEPCGLNQLYAMAYGTVPVVHAVGGLRDTVAPFDPYANTGTGFTFDRVEAAAMREALENALHTYRDFPDSFKGLMLRGMEKDFSWENVAERYEEVLVAAKHQW